MLTTVTLFIVAGQSYSYEEQQIGLYKMALVGVTGLSFTPYYLSIYSTLPRLFLHWSQFSKTNSMPSHLLLSTDWSKSKGQFNQKDYVIIIMTALLSEHANYLAFWTSYTLFWLSSILSSSSSSSHWVEDKLISLYIGLLWVWSIGEETGESSFTLLYCHLFYIYF